MSLQDVRDAYTDMRHAERTFEEAVRSHFTPGLKCWYRHGDHVINCEVISSAGYRRVKVRGESGKEYWIDAARFLS